MKHSNIALFVPHIGCPQRCSFCNQLIISGQQKRLSAQDVREAVKTAVGKGNIGAELAFFGGSFTAIDRDYMLLLLEAAKPFVEDGSVSGLRISTRPDAVDRELLKLLKGYGLKAVELGAQSMDDRVLELNERGHGALDVRKASALIKDEGLELGLQMMTDLYGDTKEGAVRTAKELIKLRPDTVRIYPTITLEGTRLAALYRSGKYRPMSLDEQVELCARLLLLFKEAGIRVIRCGLHSGGGVSEGCVAGAYHPAFGELCESRIYLERLKKHFEEGPERMPKGRYRVFVPERALSKAVGFRRSNSRELQEAGYVCSFFESPELTGEYNFYTEEDKDDS